MGTGVEEVVAAPIIDEFVGAELLGAGAGEAAAGAAAAEAAAPAAAEAAVAPAAAEAAAPAVTEAAAPAAYDASLASASPMSVSPEFAPSYADQIAATTADIAGQTGIGSVVYPSADIEAYANLGGTPEQIAAAAKDVTEPFNLEDFLNKYGKYGALGGQALLGGLQARGLAKQAGKLRSELGDLPGAKQALATGQEMVAGAKAGQLLPGQDAAVQQFRSDKMAQLESYLQRAGIRDSSSAAALRNQVENQVQNYRQTLLQANLNQGMQLMGVSDAATAAAIKAGYGANADAANLAQRYAAAAAYPLSGVYGPLTPGR